MHLHVDLQAGRPAVLVHDDRLDDVELPRRRRSRPTRRSCSTTATPAPPTSACSGISPSRPGSPASAPAPRSSATARRRACAPREGRDLSRPAGGRLDGLAALARGVRLGLRGARRRHLALLDLGRHRRLHGVRRRRPDAARLPGRAAGACARRPGRGVEPGGHGRSSARSGSSSITEPMPSMPLCFWGDPDGSRYRESYFDMFPGVWRHGDWIEITDRGTAIISGRSDATINRGGVRMGTSEIYRAVLALDEVVDALVARPAAARHRRLHAAFVVLRDGRRARRRPRRADPRAGSARTARRGTSPTSSSRSPRCRARSRARCSSCPSSGSCSAPPPTRPSAATRSRTRPRSSRSRQMAQRPPYATAGVPPAFS